MKYDHAEELSTLIAPYKGHRLEPFIKLMGDNFVYDVLLLLNAADDLRFPRHSQASIAQLQSLLQKCIDTLPSEKFSDYLFNNIGQASHRKRHNGFLLDKLRFQLEKLHDFMYGTWYQIDSHVFTGEGQRIEDGLDVLTMTFQVPKRDQAEFVELTHQITQSHLKDLIARLSKTSCVKSWLFYDPKLEEKVMREPCKEEEQSLLDAGVRDISGALKEMASYLSENMKGFLKGVERMFHYRRSPEFYIFIIRLLEFRGMPSQAEFITHFESLYGKSSSVGSSKNTGDTYYHLECLCITTLRFRPNSAFRETLEESAVGGINLLLKMINHHVASVQERLEEEKTLSIARTQENLSTHYRWCPKNNRTKEELKVKLEQFMLAVQTGQYECGTAPKKRPHSVGLFASVQQINPAALTLAEEPMAKRTRSNK